MPHIDLNEYNRTESKMRGGGGFAQMEPGIYELYIQAIRTEWDTKNGHTDGIAQQCIRIVWDVNSGDFEKRYCDAYFVDWNGLPLEDKDFMHSCFLSWRKSNYGYLKHCIEVLNACNPGFDALAAFNANRWDLFVGKRFWGVVNGEVDLNRNGFDRWKLNLGPWLSREQVLNGEAPPPIVKDNRNRPKSPC